MSGLETLWRHSFRPAEYETRFIRAQFLSCNKVPHVGLQVTDYEGELVEPMSHTSQTLVP